jgi:hypothetical protein
MRGAPLNCFVLEATFPRDGVNSNDVRSRFRLGFRPSPPRHLPLLHPPGPNLQHRYIRIDSWGRGCPWTPPSSPSPNSTTSSEGATQGAVLAPRQPYHSKVAGGGYKTDRPRSPRQARRRGDHGRHGYDHTMRAQRRTNYNESALLCTQSTPHPPSGPRKPHLDVAAEMSDRGRMAMCQTSLDGGRRPVGLLRYQCGLAVLDPLSPTNTQRR